MRNRRLREPGPSGLYVKNRRILVIRYGVRRSLTIAVAVSPLSRSIGRCYPSRFTVSVLTSNRRYPVSRIQLGRTPNRGDCGYRWFLVGRKVYPYPRFTADPTNEE